MYDACVLPTRRPFAAANAVSPAGCVRLWSTRGVFSQSCVCLPPSRRPARPRPDLSRPFAPPDDEDGGEAPVAKKQKRRKRELKGELRAYRVRMVPTPEQRRELKRCFAAVRHAYNHTVNAMNDGARANFYERRAAYRASGDRPEWTKAVASNIVAGGVEAAVNAVRTNLAKKRKNPSHAFTVRRLSHRKTPTEVLRIDPDSTPTAKTSTLLRFDPLPVAQRTDRRAECLALFGNNLKATGGIKLQDSRRVVDMLLAEGRRLVETCRIQWDKRTDRFYFIYVYDLPPQPDPDPQFATKRLVATDPGVRAFQTWYSPTGRSCGSYGELFQGGAAQIEARCLALDRMASRVKRRANGQHSDPSNPAHAQRRSAEQRRRTFRTMRRKLAAERVRLRGFVEAGHYASAGFLLRYFDVIVAPSLAVARMVPRDDRVFGCKVARAMLTWSHGLFTRRLQSAAYRFAGRHVIADSGEPGTSKTCAHCGHWHAALRANKVFNCPRCGVRMDRDVAGARNNFFAAYGRARGIGWDGLTH